MGKLRVEQSSLNGGEISPLMKGRSDIPRYRSSLETCLNQIPLLGGGTTSRPGTILVGPTAHPNNVLLIPFRYCTATMLGIVIELGDGLIRFHTSNGTIRDGVDPYQLVSPITAAMLPEVNFEQYENTLYLVHRDLHPQRLICTGLASWVLEPLPFTGWPFARLPEAAGITMTPDATSGPVTLTTSADWFTGAMIGTLFQVNGIVIHLDSLTDARTGGGQVLKPALIADTRSRIVSTFTLTINPATLTGNTDLTLKTTTSKAVDSLYQALATTIVIPLLPLGVTATRNSSYALTGTNQAWIDTVVLHCVKATMAAQAEIVIEMIATYTFVWTPRTDYANYANWFATTVTAIIPGTPPTGVTAAATTTNVPITGMETDSEWKVGWGPYTGYPRAITFFEQRLILAGTPTWPTTIWGSAIGDVLDFTVGATTADAWSFILTAATTLIAHVKATDRIYVFTLDRELTLDPGATGALSATNMQIKTRTNHGSCYHPPPVVTSGAMIMFSPARTQARSLSWRFEIDSYIAPPISLLAEHLLKDHGGAVDTCYSREPYSCLWITTTDGSLLSCTYDRDQEVLAWARHQLGGGGVVKGVTVIPTSSGFDEVWLAVKRNGAGYLERMDLTGTVFLDGATVTETGITGHAYQQILKDLPLELNNQGQSATNANMALGKITVRLVKTLGATINGQQILTRRINSGLLDQTPKLFTGDFTVQSLGRGTNPADSQVEIIQNEPYPLTVLAIIKEVTING